MPNKILTIVIGAGASHDCVDDARNRDLHPQEFRPPLVRHLFNRGRGTDPILHAYPGAEALADQIRSTVSRGENLETFLRQCESSPHPQVRKQYRQVPLYLQRYLYLVSRQWGAIGGTKFDTLVRAVATSEYDHVLYLTLNYDQLLERALTKFYGGHRFNDVKTSYEQRSDAGCPSNGRF